MQDSLELRQYYFIVRRWLWLIVLCTILGAGGAFAVSTQTTPVYQASTTLLVQQAPAGDGSEYQSILTSERLARTYSEMLKARPIMELVINQLSLEERPQDLAERVSVELVRDTQLIRLRVEHTDPATAARAANAVAEAFVSYTETLKQSRFAESMASLQQQTEQLARLIEETEERSDALGPDEGAEQARLEGILAGYRNTYSTLVQNYEAMRVSAARSSDDVVLFEAAEMPRSPVRPRTLMNTALAGVVGAMIGLGTAFLIEYLDDTVKSPNDVEQAAGLSVLGAINRFKGDELIASKEPLSPVAEAFRTLRTNIRYSGLDEPIRTLLVTSPGPTEGKSILVSNLATVMAQGQLKVVVVDSDLRRPRQHEIFGMLKDPGLTEALVDGHMDAVIRNVTAAEGLSVIASGALPPNPAEMLGSQRMTHMIGQLREAADVVLIDSPPVLAVTDAAVLAQAVDGVLLVVEAGRTRRAELQETVEALGQVGVNVIGVVLNQIDAARSGYYYYYRHHYDGYYREDREAQKKRGVVAAVQRVFRR